MNEAWKERQNLGLFCLDYDIFILWMQWHGEVSIWDSPTTLILSQEGVGGQMGRNGGAREMPLSIRSTASGTWTEDAIVQESLWKANQAMPLLPPPLPPPMRMLLLQMVWNSMLPPLWCPATVLATTLPLQTRSTRICRTLFLQITLQPPTASTGEKTWH